MNKAEYLQELKNRLRDICEEDANDAISYYEEYFDEAGIENEQQVIADLGSPAKLATQIRADAAIRSQQNQNRQGYQNHQKNTTFHNIGVVILGIFAMPIALPLAFAAIILIFALFITIVALATAMLLCFGVIFLAGIPLIINGFLHLEQLGDGFIAIGTGLICMSMGLFVLYGFNKITRVIIPVFMNALSNLYTRARKGRSL